MAGSDSRANSPQQILQYNVIIRNYAGDTTDLTSMVTQFNIYESIFKRTTSADIVVSDAVGFTNRLPIVGDEHLIITYRSARLKKTITRSFKVYKVGTRKEGAQRQENYIIHAISEYAIFNEMRSIDKSFASQKTSEAIKNAFANGFRGDVGGVDGSSILGTKNLYGLKKDDIVESESVTSFIPPGLSPFECINYLKNECRHPEPNNNSDYIFFCPGTQHSSLYPTYLTKGFLNAIQSSESPKIFITNIGADYETPFYKASDYVIGAIKYLNKNNKKYQKKIFDIFFINKPSSKFKNYVTLDLNKFNQIDGKLFIDDFDDPLKNGHHNAKKIINLIL